MKNMQCMCVYECYQSTMKAGGQYLLLRMNYTKITE